MRDVLKLIVSQRYWFSFLVSCDRQSSLAINSTWTYRLLRELFTVSRQSDAAARETELAYARQLTSLSLISLHDASSDAG